MFPQGSVLRYLRKDHVLKWMRWTADVNSYCKLRYQKYQLKKLTKFTSVAPLQTGKILEIFLPMISICFVCPRLEIGDGYNSRRMSCGFKIFHRVTSWLPLWKSKMSFQMWKTFGIGTFLRTKFFRSHMKWEPFHLRNT